MQNLSNQLKNNEFIQRIIFGILYATAFLFCVLHKNNIFFISLIIILLIGSICEFVNLTTIRKMNFFNILILIIIVFSFFCLIQIKISEKNPFQLIILLTQVWAIDCGGYFIGKLFGKRKFSKISPSKTLEGLFGSFIFSILTVYILNNKWQMIENNIIVFVMLIFSSSVFGDLIFSKIKRMHKRKNSGLFLPGHGGFLDRLDSLIISTPIFYLYIYYF